VLREQLVVHARLVIETVKKSGGHQLDQVAISLVVLTQQYEVIRALRIRATVLMVIRRNIHFAPDDWFHPVRRGLVVKIRRCEEISVVGYRHRGHATARGFLGQLADFTSPIEKGVVRVEMKMYEVRRGHLTLF